MLQPKARKYVTQNNKLAGPTSLTGPTGLTGPTSPTLSVNTTIL